MIRRSFALLTAIAALMATVGLVTAPGQAAAYRYWTYWTATGATWAFSAVGPASSVPADGSVEGWRFALSTGTQGQGAQPRISPTDAFARFCGTEPAKSGTKRVAIVFDYGEAADAPAGQSPPGHTGTCAVVPVSYTSAQTLREVADVRVEGGLVCGIGGYPVGECAPAVAAPEPAPSQQPTRQPDRDSNPAPARDPDGGNHADKQSPQPTGTSDPSGTEAQPDPVPAGADRSPNPEQKPERRDPADPSVRPDPSAPPSGSPASDSASTATPTPSDSPVAFASGAATAPAESPNWAWLALALGLCAGLGLWIMRRRTTGGADR